MGLKINQQPVATTDACDYGAGAFKDNSYDFTATANPTNVRFEFLVGDTDAVVKIDNGMSIIFRAPFFPFFFLRIPLRGGRRVLEEKSALVPLRTVHCPPKSISKMRMLIPKL